MPLIFLLMRVASITMALDANAVALHFVITAIPRGTTQNVGRLPLRRMTLI